MVWRTVAVCSLSFVALLAVFIGLLLSTLLFIDDARIIENLKKSIDEKALTVENYPKSPFGHEGHGFDMFSECVGLGLNLSNDDQSLMYRLAAAPYIGPKHNSSLAIAGTGTPCADLVEAIRSGNVKAALPYLRFWHGYQVYLRPMLSFLSLTHIRRLNAMLLYASLLLVTYGLSWWFGPWTFGAVLIPFASVTDLFTVPLVTVHALSLAWTFSSVAIILYLIQRRGDAGITVLSVVFSSGAITNFVSFLFNPPLAPALIAFVIIAQSSKSGDTWKGSWHKVTRAGFAVGLWFSGFAAAWIAKWVIAGFVLGFSDVAGDLTVVASGKRYFNYMMMADIYHIFYPTLFVAWFGGKQLWVETAASYAIAGMVLARLAILRRLQMSQIADFLTMQVPLIVPVIWVELMRYHSVEHAGFVVRSFVVFPIFALLASLALMHKSRAPPSGS